MPTTSARTLIMPVIEASVFQDTRLQLEDFHDCSLDVDKLTLVSRCGLLADHNSTTSSNDLQQSCFASLAWSLSKSLPPYAPPSASPQVYHTSHIPPSPEPLVSVASLIVPPLEVGPVPFPLHIKLLAHRFIQICAVASDMFIPDNMAACFMLRATPRIAVPPNLTEGLLYRISATTNRLVMPTKQATNAQVLLGNYAYVHQFASDGSIIKLFSQGLIVPMLKKMMFEQVRSEYKTSSHNAIDPLLCSRQHLKEYELRPQISTGVVFRQLVNDDTAFVCMGVFVMEWQVEYSTAKAMIQRQKLMRDIRTSYMTIGRQGAVKVAEEDEEGNKERVKEVQGEVDVYELMSESVVKSIADECMESM
ncbi:hypothetical protein SERLA73DRAFT_149339 [Serpula lacrymans var. lacrymans S7.3]|uniref:Uncharacterized protein n=1 Tax=Serpula lacrymans var. lacrymans (strain S7.3) TaxID=936435 RepID=F8PHY1_SERL3|nr:hypothetical protein SERLA73DRAFT_149339 [Serpula lacrymans var. lacrymans S7.3]